MGAGSAVNWVCTMGFCAREKAGSVIINAPVSNPLGWDKDLKVFIIVIVC